MTTHKATCQCGALKVTLDGDPDFVIACNCKACQRRTGAPFGTAGYFRKTAMSVEGQTNTWGRTADSGRALENFFCPTCGTNVYWTLEMRPDHVGVAYGCFETKMPDPVRAIWTDEKHSWVGFPEDWPTFPQGTPEP